MAIPFEAIAGYGSISCQLPMPPCSVLDIGQSNVSTQLRSCNRLDEATRNRC